MHILNGVQNTIRTGNAVAGS